MMAQRLRSWWSAPARSRSLPPFEEDPHYPVDEGGVAGRVGAEGDADGALLFPGDHADDPQDGVLPRNGQAEADRLMDLPCGGPAGDADPSQGKVLEGDVERLAVVQEDTGRGADVDADVPLPGEAQEGRDVHAVPADDFGPELELQHGVVGEERDQGVLLDAQQDGGQGGPRRGDPPRFVVEQPHLAEEPAGFQTCQDLERLPLLFTEDGHQALSNQIEGVDRVPFPEDDLPVGDTLLPGDLRETLELGRLQVSEQADAAQEVSEQAASGRHSAFKKSDVLCGLSAPRASLGSPSPLGLANGRFVRY